MNILRHQKGVGLVEVLIALLILAIGVLGFIALKYRAVEATHESGSRVEAINLARDMAERIRVNRGAIDAYEVRLSKPVADQIAAPKDCSKTNCPALDLANCDVLQVAKQAQVTGMVMNRIP
uniref:type IV pilus modification protein PilV n=1 Tax=uncultured Acinetobacter sp. TaxID=165433 RepID=UPI00262F2B30